MQWHLEEKVALPTHWLRYTIVPFIVIVSSAVFYLMLSVGTTGTINHAIKNFVDLWSRRSDLETDVSM